MWYRRRNSGYTMRLRAGVENGDIVVTGETHPFHGEVEAARVSWEAEPGRAGKTPGD